MKRLLFAALLAAGSVIGSAAQAEDSRPERSVLKRTGRVLSAPARSVYRARHCRCRCVR